MTLEPKQTMEKDTVNSPPGPHYLIYSVYNAWQCNTDTVEIHHYTGEGGLNLV